MRNVICAIFAIFGALFLFILAGLMNSDYPYVHMAGNMPNLSMSVSYAGVIYFLLAVVCVGLWARDAYLLGQFSDRSSFAQVQ